jgi:cytochrome c oxidase subunit I
MINQSLASVVKPQAELAAGNLGGNHFVPINVFVSVSAFCLGLSTIPFLINFFYSIFNGPKAPKNPWRSTTLEWTLPSPPGHGNFETTPTVYHGPYEYSVPGMEEDFLPQNQPAPETVKLAAH